jgi:hypothetical protein
MKDLSPSCYQEGPSLKQEDIPSFTELIVSLKRFLNQDIKVPLLPLGGRRSIFEKSRVGLFTENNSKEV